jgi:hypothetical protein
MKSKVAAQGELWERRSGRFLSLTLIAGAILVGFGVAESSLRAFPHLIAVPVLDRFTPVLRQEVATRLGLPTVHTRPRIPSSERTDGGPDIHVFEPNRTIVVRVDPADLRFGATDSIAVDAGGFCNPSGAIERGAADIVLLGDSFTSCIGVKPTVVSAAVLEKETGLRAYHLGIPGIGPYEYIELLRRYGLRLRPRVVVMNIYEGNDLRDIGRFMDFRASGVQRDKSEAMGGPFAWSYALAFIKASVEQLAKSLKKSMALDFRYSVVSGGNAVAMNVTNADQDEARNANRIISQELAPKLFEAPLAEFARMAREMDFKAVVSYIPSAYTAYESRVRFEDAGIGKSVQASSKAQRSWLRDNTRRLGITFVDLVPAFQAAADRGPLTHFPANVHLTAAGHQVVARELALQLRQYF